MIKCIRGTKVGDSLIRNEDGSLQSIYPDTFYPKGIIGYWMLKRIGDWWKILKVLIVQIMDEPTEKEQTIFFILCIVAICVVAYMMFN